MIIFVMMMLPMAFSSLAFVLPLLLPVASALFALWLLKRDEEAYVGFTCWLYFLTPFLRRVVDERIGLRETMMMFAPYAATAMCGSRVVRRLPSLSMRRDVPFVLILWAVCFTVITSLLQLPFGLVAQGVLTWTLPILFGMFCFLPTENHVNLFHGFRRAMIGGTLVTGFYGIIQFFLVPSWDAHWYDSVDVTSMGVPVPMQIRVFSTMNAPQVLGAFLVCGILMSFMAPGKLRYVVVPVGLVTLAFSSARSAWLGLILGVVCLAWRASAEQRVRLVAIGLLCLLALALATQLPEVRNSLNTRVQSLTNVKGDESVDDRTQVYVRLLRDLRERPYGLGLGSEDDPIHGRGNDQRDSSVVNLLLSFGLLSSVGFAMGVFLLFKRTVIVPRNAASEALVLQACTIALIAEAPTNSIFTGPLAFLTFSLLGLGYAQHLQSRTLARKQEQPLQPSWARLNTAVRR